jgi:hypothetical protein
MSHLGGGGGQIVFVLLFVTFHLHLHIHVLQMLVSETNCPFKPLILTEEVH